jgi:Cu-Zn family superoxide dismutase
MSRTVLAASAAAITLLSFTAAPVASAQDEDLTPRNTFGTYESYRDGATAVTYDEAQVPAGASTQVSSEPLGGGKSKVTVVLRGLQPNHTYGAHVHTRPCGATGEAAGPHFQQVVDPVQPSVDPRYANPVNEVWLDFTTDAAGNGAAEAVGNWRFRGRNANSLVVHEHGTHSGGQAGARLACLTTQY